MQEHCAIVKDLLPLYVEDLLSEQSENFVCAHLAVCDDCTDYYHQLMNDDPRCADKLTAITNLKLAKQERQQTRKRGLFFGLVIGILVAIVIGVIGNKLINFPVYTMQETALTTEQAMQISEEIAISAEESALFDDLVALESPTEDAIYDLLSETFPERTWYVDSLTDEVLYLSCVDGDTVCYYSFQFGKRDTLIKATRLDASDTAPIYDSQNNETYTMYENKLSVWQTIFG